MQTSSSKEWVPFLKSSGFVYLHVSHGDMVKIAICFVQYSNPITLFFLTLVLVVWVFFSLRKCNQDNQVYSVTETSPPDFPTLRAI